jgi:predicted ArsR family transcriptional regulator
MSPQQQATTTRQRHVLDVLAVIAAATVADLAAYSPFGPDDPPALGMDEQGIRNHLAALKAAGLVRTVPGTRPRRFELTR